MQSGIQLDIIAVQDQILHGILTGGQEGRAAGPQTRGRIVSKVDVDRGTVIPQISALYRLGHLIHVIGSKLQRQIDRAGACRAHDIDVAAALLRQGLDGKAGDRDSLGFCQVIVHAVQTDCTQDVVAGCGERIAGHPIAVRVLREGHFLLTGTLAVTDGPEEERRDRGRLGAVNIHGNVRSKVRTGIPVKAGLVHRRGNSQFLGLQFLIGDGIQLRAAAELDVQLALDIRGREDILVGQLGAIQINDCRDPGSNVLFQIRDRIGYFALIVLAQVDAVGGREDQRNDHSAIFRKIPFRIHLSCRHQLAILVNKGNIEGFQQFQASCLVFGGIGIVDITAAAALGGGIGGHHRLVIVPNAVFTLIADDGHDFLHLGYRRAVSKIVLRQNGVVIGGVPGGGLCRGSILVLCRRYDLVDIRGIGNCSAFAIIRRAGNGIQFHRVAVGILTGGSDALGLRKDVAFQRQVAVGCVGAHPQVNCEAVGVFGNSGAALKVTGIQAFRMDFVIIEQEVISGSCCLNVGLNRSRDCETRALNSSTD